MAEAAMSSERTLFWKPIRVFTSVLALIAGAATLIANVDTIGGLFKPSLSGAWVLTLDNKSSSLPRYEGMNSTYQLYLVQDDADHLRIWTLVAAGMWCLSPTRQEYQRPIVRSTCRRRRNGPPTHEVGPPHS